MVINEVISCNKSTTGNHFCGYLPAFILFLFAVLISTAIGTLFLVPSQTEAAVTPISCDDPHAMTTCLSLTTDQSTVSIPLSPTRSTNSFAYAESKVTTRTNAPGYNLTLSTNSADDSSRSLHRRVTAEDPTPSTISPTTGSPATSTTSANPSPLSINQWGFTLSGTPTPTASAPIWQYIPNLSNPTPIIQNGTSNDTEGNSTTVYYGVEADITKPAGHYTTTIVYTATVTPFSPPTITSVSPAAGPTAGGTQLTITGTNFYDITGAQIGGISCTTYTVNSPTQISCTTPSSTAGTRDITIISENGTTTSPGAFTYIPAPTITDRSPSTGIVNGNTVNITGTNFTPASPATSGITSNNNYATCTISSNTAAACSISGIPEGSSGTITVTITTTGGTATTSFDYAQPYVAPTITNISNSIPTANGTTQGTVTATTDKNANCKWNRGADFTYATQGTAFTTGQGTTNHSTTVTGLQGGANTIYVRCTHSSSESAVSAASTTSVTILNPVALQSLTAANCPAYTAPLSERVAYDARNNQLYYVGKVGTTCWMMSNLRYGGDGNWNSSWGWTDDRYATSTSNNTANTNDNSRPLAFINQSGNGSSSYYNAQFANPGGSTDYTNTSPNGGFYGYLYNWCAAMGGQSNACNESSNSGFNTSISICPSGWRLPGGGQSATTSGNNFGALNTAINSGNTSSDSGLRTNFLGVYSGYYNNGASGTGSGLGSQGREGSYWSSTSAFGQGAYALYFSSTSVSPGTTNGIKGAAHAIRCIRT